jgi:UDP-glucose 4-epimerase
LSRQGYKVSIFDIRESDYLLENQKMIIGDILNLDQVDAAIKEQDYVYNFAGLADIDDAKDNPIRTAQLNIMGNINILEASKNHNVKRFIFASSAYVFSGSGGFYKASKQSSEKFIEEYQKRYDLDFTILRYGSLYGRRSDMRNGIYRLLKDALDNQQITYKGTGEELREYIHVEDAARLSVDILDKQYKNRHLMLTGIEKMKVGDLMTMISEILGGDIQINLSKDRFTAHYKVTPYSYTPTIGHKLVSTDHVDIGQGLLDVIAELSENAEIEDWQIEE